MIEVTQRNAPSAPNLGRRIGETLQLLQDSVPMQRHVVHAGDTIYRVGQDFECLHVLHCGLVKLVNLSAEGREQVVSLHFKGDWLGMDGIATGHYACEAIALDTGEVWSIRYDALLQAAVRTPALLTALHEAMSRALALNHESLQTRHGLPTDARVAEFLRYWSDAQAQRGQRTDQITLCLSRSEIGNYLGMTLESVSRALSHLARVDVIRFLEKGRREIHIPKMEALRSFVQSNANAHGAAVV
jgi:CRP/FNR family transcriptional regulator